MPHSIDDSALVPKPPPPRPAGRDAAILAALRRFDGEDEAPAPAKARRSWVGHPQLAWAITACLVAVVGLPTAFIVMRDGNSPVFQASPPSAKSQQEVQDSVADEAPPALNNVTFEARAAPPAGSRAAEAQSISQSAQKQSATVANKPADELAAAAEPSTMAYAAAPPPPPPPPPPAAPMLAEKSAGGMVSNDIAVTGSRMRRSNVVPQREESLALDSLPARDALTREVERVLSPQYRACFGKDAPLNAESYSCLDREYHRLDRILASEYASALARQTDEAARQRLQKDERRWLRTRFRHCEDEVGDLRGSTAAVVNESCEIDALASRIAILRKYGR